MARIAVWTHAHDEIETKPSTVNEMSTIWREQGHEVFVCAGAREPAAADLVIVHIDRTVIPLEYQRILARLERTVNGRVLDISKRNISEHIIERSSDWAGPVIVKTDANCGGRPEWEGLRRAGTPSYRVSNWLRKRTPWTWHSRLSKTGYRIYESKQHVPAAVWWNRALVVEKFLPERRDGFYCLRIWMFFGNCSTHSLIYANDPIVKGTGIVRIEPLGEPPPELVERRRELGFEFGKFDYVISDGKVVLLDANRTPSLPYSPERFRPKAEVLAGGLTGFL